jgi:hypothetical protein
MATQKREEKRQDEEKSSSDVYARKRNQLILYATVVAETICKSTIKI